MCKTIIKLSKFVKPPSSPNTVNRSEYNTTKMLPPSGQLLSESECRNLGHDPGKQDGGSTTQCFKALLVEFSTTGPFTGLIFHMLNLHNKNIQPLLFDL